MESRDEPASAGGMGLVAAALRVDPDSSAAAQALLTLESAKELPMAARTTYRFREPRDPAYGVWSGTSGCAAATWAS